MSVNSSRLSTYLLGTIFIMVGLGILLNNLHFFHFNFGQFIVPMILTLIGIKLLERGKRIAGGILTVIGALMLLGAFGIDVGNLFGLAFSVVVIYVGYRMMRTKKKEFTIPSGFEHEEDEARPAFTEQKNNAWSEKQQSKESGEQKRNGSFSHEPFHKVYSDRGPKVRHSLIGNLYLTASRWELTDMNIWYGIGEVKIDLSRAHIPDKETVLIINGWIGDVDIYVPYDLELALTAHVNIGDIDVFGNEEGGINRNVSMETAQYHNASRRVHVIANLMIGDVDVMYV